MYPGYRISDQNIKYLINNLTLITTKSKYNSFRPKRILVTEYQIANIKYLINNLTLIKTYAEVKLDQIKNITA